MYIDEIWIKGQGYIENPKSFYKTLYRGRGRRSNSNYHKKCLIKRYEGIKESCKKVTWDINYMIFGGSCVKAIELRNGGKHNERGRISKDFGTIG